MKKTLVFLLILLLLLPGCTAVENDAQIAATTATVYAFTSRLCQGTALTVTQLVTEDVSCLHDYSLNVRQVKAAEAAEYIVISGAGLESFMEDLLSSEKVWDASEGIDLICPEENQHHNHGHAHHDHSHDSDPHIWLSPENAKIMAQNICRSLTEAYPEYREIFSVNLDALLTELDELQLYGAETLADLRCREIITFHDGFAYFAQAFDLTILEAVEEESGSEASAGELIHLIEEVEHHGLPAIFTETNGSCSAAEIISRETGAEIFVLDMAMGTGSYFDAMYRNIDTVKEALQ